MQRHVQMPHPLPDQVSGQREHVLDGFHFRGQDDVSDHTRARRHGTEPKPSRDWGVEQAVQPGPAVDWAPAVPARHGHLDERSPGHRYARVTEPIEAVHVQRCSDMRWTVVVSRPALERRDAAVDTVSTFEQRGRRARAESPPARSERPGPFTGSGL